MKNLLFLFLISVFVFFSCKKNDDAPQLPRDEAPVLHSFQAMRLAENEFIRIGDSLNIKPPEALGLTVDYVQNLPGVTDVLYLDNHHLRITTTDGFTNIISINEVDENGLSLFRGSPGATSSLTTFAGDCSNTIENKKILLFAAAHDEFYSGNEYQTRVVDAIENGEVDVEVTVLKNEECTPQIMQTFNEYGLVIMDTHGQLDGVRTGLRFSLIEAEVPGSVDAFHDMLRSKLGTTNFDLFQKKQLGLGTEYKYDPKLEHQEIWREYKKKLSKYYWVWITSKGVRDLVPDLEETILFANCCYSGFRATYYTPLNKTFDPIQPAWMSKNPIAYYGYEATNNKASYDAFDSYCKENADTLIHALFHAGDSTGQAHLFNDITINTQPWIGWPIDEGLLNFNVYGNENWCYGVCGQDLVDERDGQVYKTVCIGDQVWMAENLNWAGAGVYYDNNPANGDVYGRLYSIYETTQGKVSTPDQPVQGICPDGWHVPSKEEFEKLLDEVGLKGSGDVLRGGVNWHNQQGEYSDPYGFSALPGGQYNWGTFESIKFGTYFWTSSKNGPYYSNLFRIWSTGDAYIGSTTTQGPDNSYYNPGGFFYAMGSVRCIKDD